MAEKPIHRRLAAILVADVVGYSRMMEADEVGTFEALKERRRHVLEPVVSAHGGRIVKLMGDGVLLEFPSAINAVEAALQLQLKMTEANVGIPAPRQIILRIGINIGDVIGEGSDIYGEGVNIAARLETLAEPGGICMSEKVHNEVQGKISIRMKDLGLVQLKNIAAPVRTFGMMTARALPSTAVFPSKEYTTVAVLPLTNMSGNADQEYFADGVTEDIITELSRFKNLSVVARNTTFSYKGQSVNVAEVGRQLGADFVLEGSIRLADQHLRASVQLIDAQTGAHVFAERFDREMAEIFAVQDQIVEAIIGRLFFNLQEVAGVVRGRTSTTSISAYTSWLRAGAAWRNGDERGAREHMHDAIRIDPTYAPALASLGLLYAYWRFSEPNAATDVELENECQHFAARAIAADKTDPFVLTSVAACFLLVGKIDDAIRYSGIAIAISPHDINVLVARGMIIAYAGRHEEGLALVERGCKFEPLLPPAFVSSLGDCYYLARRFDSALAAYGTLINPPYFFRLNQAACLAQLGRVEEAAVIARQKPDTFDAIVYARNTIRICALPEDGDLWMDGFQKAGMFVSRNVP
ncbi:adenylate/guanylate cyclase domain-containing protein [Rhizobium sp. WSM1274]|uniref:adenylate/guanylate cyclase domain-containing protein n=1 Tax=Rhizobium sp. WSM1274 TaxID=3138254 RepID=UPI0021A8A66A|nr:adenylate/guanylate cyclase domain-containing protein [Rhizobium leguminosarum]UWU29173.1 adenylate/guanylate cyclase domain-containing protein [Rhizobium leguminosarum bv. viciae]